jgi:hypothetical protein
MEKKAYTPSITIRWRPIDTWFGAECPDCGVSILDRTIAKVKRGMQSHGKKSHNWNGIDFNEQV